MLNGLVSLEFVEDSVNFGGASILDSNLNMLVVSNVRFNNELVSVVMYVGNRAGSCRVVCDRWMWLICVPNDASQWVGRLIGWWVRLVAVGGIIEWYCWYGTSLSIFWRLLAIWDFGAVFYDGSIRTVTLRASDQCVAVQSVLEINQERLSAATGSWSVCFGGYARMIMLHARCASFLVRFGPKGRLDGKQTK